MKHNARCLRLQAELEAFKAKWPNFCTHCGGWGVIPYAARIYRDGSGEPGGADPCSYCLEKGLCPRCGKELNMLVRGYYDWGYCTHCGWDEHQLFMAYGNWGELVAPDFECECWFDEENQGAAWAHDIEHGDFEMVEALSAEELEEAEREEAERMSYYINDYFDKVHNPDPVRFEDDAWWFYDETWSYRIGPFADEATARSELAHYTSWLMSPKVCWGGVFDPERERVQLPLHTSFQYWYWDRSSATHTVYLYGYYDERFI